MLIQFDKIKEHGIIPRGVIHVGMHKAEEYPIYKKSGVPTILFVEANKELAHSCDIDDDLCYIVHAAVSDKVEEVDFNITNNNESSSILELAEHSNIYPNIVKVSSVKMKTVTLDTVIKKVGVYDFTWNILNLDIQGAELKAMMGLTDWSNIEAVFTEVNYKEMYKGCPLIEDVDKFLFEKGFRKVEEVDTGCGWGDALYVRPDIEVMSNKKKIKIVKKDIVNFDLSKLDKYGQKENIRDSVAGTEAYKFYAYLGTLVNDTTIIEVGTRHGDSALATAYNDSNKVISFDIQYCGSDSIKKNNLEFVIGNFMEHGINWSDVDVIIIDVDPHDAIKEEVFLRYLIDQKWEGLLVLDDVLDNWPCAIAGANPAAMHRWWNALPYEKYELSEVGHYSGTGLVNIGKKFEITVE